jgi:hypothetical protein
VIIPRSLPPTWLSATGINLAKHNAAEYELVFAKVINEDEGLWTCDACMVIVLVIVLVVVSFFSRGA